MYRRLVATGIAVMFVSSGFWGCYARAAESQQAHLRGSLIGEGMVDQEQRYEAYDEDNQAPTYSQKRRDLIDWIIRQYVNGLKKEKFEGVSDPHDYLSLGLAIDELYEDHFDADVGEVYRKAEEDKKFEAFLNIDDEDVQARDQASRELVTYVIGIYKGIIGGRRNRILEGEQRRHADVEEGCCNSECLRCITVLAIIAFFVIVGYVYIF